MFLAKDYSNNLLQELSDEIKKYKKADTLSNTSTRL